MNELHQKYIECIKLDLEYEYSRLDSNYKITTVYIGGGTPSLIESTCISEIIKTIKNLDSCAEITIELNPGTVTKQKLMDYREAGINRLSIGLQSTNNNILKSIGRIHTYEQFLDIYYLARDIGFNNINVDLMLGLPGQTIQDLNECLENVIELNPEHISVYSLILEENTKLYDMVNKGIVTLPDEEQERQMYWYVKNTLELAGYNHYEISNFAKAGFESRHNTNCWKQKEYMGIGLNASSYLSGVRYSNISDLRNYVKNIENGDFGKNRIIEETQNDEDKQKEFMLLGLRMIDGVNIQEFKNRFSTNPLFVFRNQLHKLNNSGLLVIDGNTIKLTNKGLDLANQVWIEFV